MQRTLSPDSSDGTIEQLLVAKGKTAPRITPDHIHSCIAEVNYFTAAEGKLGAQGAMDTSSADPLNLLTICVLVLRNGFTVTGESACASPETFDADIGMRLAYSKAVDKVWMLEGYLLKQRLHDAPPVESARPLDMLFGSLPRYKSHRIVSAAKIVAIDFGERLDLAPYGVADVGAEWIKHRRAQVGGYYIVYDDGYTSWSPASAFEKGYTAVGDVS